MNDLFFEIFLKNDEPDFFRDNFDEVKSFLITVPHEQIFDFICNNENAIKCIEPNNIPQFSNADLLPKVVNIVANSSELRNFADVGYFLTDAETKLVAQRKFGENHYKLASQLGLVLPISHHFGLTSLGEMYYSETDDKKKSIIAKKLAWRIPIIQYSILQASKDECDLHSLLLKYLSESTAVRRRSNIFTLLNWINDSSGFSLQHVINNIVWKK